MSNSTLWEKTFWTAPIDYITSTYIREYDISKANINVLLSMGVIDQEQYNYFYGLDKKAREIMVGYLLKDHKKEKLGVKLLAGIKEYRKLFFEANDIQDYEVLAIKNDAVYLINKIANHTKFGNVEFVNKHSYTSFYKLDRKFNKEMYYKIDIPNNIEELKIDGLGDKAYREHEPYMIDFLKAVFSTVETTGVEDAIAMTRQFSDDYVNRRLDVGYYRRFDSISGYDSICHNTIGDMYNINYLSQNDMRIIDISYNYLIIMNLYRYFASMYFKKK